MPAALVLGALALLAGCGEVEVGDRVPLEGTVTKSGQLLDVPATVYFDPVDKAGVGSSGEVAQGKFVIPAESGPTPGQKYKVKVITAPGIPAEGTPRNQIKLPRTYNTTVEIPPRDADNNEPLEIAFP